LSTDVTSRLAALSVEERNALAHRLYSRRPASRSHSIPRRNRDDDGLLPLSFAQQRFWFLNQIGPLNSAYNVADTHRLRGPLDVDALHRAFELLVERHEVLRTVFRTVDGRPVQRILPSRSIAMEYEDLAGHSDVKAALEQRFSDIWNAPWNLEIGPLVRARAWRLGPEDHLTTIIVHHILSDGWSKAVLIGELADIYASLSNGRAPALAPLPIQYGDFAVWQQEWMTGVEARRQLDYWKKQLADLPVLQLPADRVTRSSASGIHHTVVLSEELSRSARAFAQREGVTLFMTFLAAFGSVLSRYASQPEVVIGTPTANRNRPEVQNLIGSFMNPLPVRVDGRGNPTFRELVTRVREACVGMFANQETPFDVLVRTIQPHRDATAPPLFQAMLLFHNMWKSMALSSDGLAATAFTVDDGVLRSIDGVRGPGDLVYPVALEVTDLGSRLLACFEYAHEFATVLAALPGHFQTFLTAVVDDPDLRVVDAPLLSAAERRTLLADWNHESRPYPVVCVHRLFEEQARREPQSIAVVMGAEQVTYEALNARANRLARRLRAQGIGPEARVGILLDRSPRMFEAVLGVMKSGGAYVPLDSAYPPDRLAFVLENAGIGVLVAEPALSDVVERLGARGTDLPIIWLDPADDSASDPADLADGPAPGNLAYVIYTSGSTGMPKGTMVTHANLANAYHAWEKCYDLKTGPRRHLQMASLSFDVFSGDLVRALCSGGTLVVAPHDLLFAPDQLYALMRRESVDAAEFVPVVLRDVLGYLESTGQDLSFLRLLAAGSDTWYAHEYRKVRRLCGPETRVVNSYGLTETTIDSTWFESAAPEGDAPLPLGRAFPNTDLYVLDTRRQPVPVGVPGELYIGGAGVARGYLDSPALTADRFVPNPFSTVPGARLYRTGDQARYLADGNLEFLGRIDQQVKLRGFRIEPGEIEAVLGSDPSVESAVVVIRDDPPAGKRLVAYVVAAPGTSPQPADLRRLAKDRLPEHMVPAIVMLIDRLPLTPNGKIDRRALPAPEAARQSVEAYVAPRTEAELKVAAIWCEVLGVPQVGASDNFFDLGGHSMLAVKVVARLERAFGVGVPVRVIFETQTLAEQAARVEMMAVVAAPAAPSADALDEVLL
jgi:amino acid adenylation domain-containing protein